MTIALDEVEYVFRYEGLNNPIRKVRFYWGRRSGNCGPFVWKVNINGQEHGNLWDGMKPSEDTARAMLMMVSRLSKQG